MAERVLTAFDGGVTSFDEMSTVEFSPLIELDSANGLSPQYRDATTETNGATVTHSGSEFILTTGGTASAQAILSTKERGRYQPGLESIAGVAIRRPTAPTGGQSWQAGYFDDQNGYWLGEDSTGLYAQMRTGGVDRAKVYQADWNHGADLSLNLKKTTVVRFPHQCYYGGPLRIEAIVVGAGGSAKREELHHFGPVDGEPILQQSKLPIRVQAQNGSTSSSFDFRASGRHYGIRGRYFPNRRITAQETPATVTIGTSYTPLISFKKRNDYENQAKSVKINGIGILSDTDAVWALMQGGTLSGANFGAPDNIASAETAMFADTAATAINLTGAIAIDKGVVAGGQGNRSSVGGIRNLGEDLPDDTEITLVAKTLSGTGNAAAVIAIEEEW